MYFSQQSIIHACLILFHSLRDAELKYKNRGSRPEDIAAIREIKSIVKEQERKMKQLIVCG